MHDTLFVKATPVLEEVKALGILETLPLQDLSAAKMRVFTYYTQWHHLPLAWP